MKLYTRLALIAFGLTLSTAVSAEQVALVKLQCLPKPPLMEGTANVICPKETNGLVDLQQCYCPDNFLLVNASRTGAFQSNGGAGGPPVSGS